MPTNESIEEHRKELQKLWRSKEWKDACREYIGGQGCSVCGTMDSLLVHHPEDTVYRDRATYLDFETCGCLVLCRSCHYKLHKGYPTCSTCGKYCRGETCYNCTSEDVKQQRLATKEKWKQVRRELSRAAYLRSKEWLQNKDRGEK